MQRCFSGKQGKKDLLCSGHSSVPCTLSQTLNKRRWSVGIWGRCDCGIKHTNTWQTLSLAAEMNGWHHDWWKDEQKVSDYILYLCIFLMLHCQSRNKHKKDRSEDHGRWDFPSTHYHPNHTTAGDSELDWPTIKTRERRGKPKKGGGRSRGVKKCSNNVKHKGKKAILQFLHN